MNTTILNTTKLITIILDNRLQKTFKLNNDGNLQKMAIANLANYQGETVELSLDNIQTAIDSGGHTIIAGTVLNSQEKDVINFTSESNFNRQFPNANDVPFKNDRGEFISARTKKHLTTSPLLLLDYDTSNETPDHLKKLIPQDLIDKLTAVFPEFSHCGWVASYSSSAGITNSNGVQLTPCSSIHIYIIVQDGADLKRFKDTLFARSVLSGLYWFKSLKNGTQKLQTIFDISAISHERLCYEANPLCLDGLTSQRPPSQFVNGSILNTSKLLDLTPKEVQEFQNIKNPIQVNSAPSGIISPNNTDKTSLKPNTQITLSSGQVITTQEFYNTGQAKSPCYSPFRQDTNPSAFIARHESNTSIYLCDSGLSTTYFCDFILQTKQNDLPFLKKPATIENLKALLDSLAIRCRYNLIAKNTEIIFQSEPDNRIIDNADNIAVAKITSFAVEYGFKISNENLKKYLEAIALKNYYNPVIEWVSSKKWDGLDRISQLTQSLILKDSTQVIFRDITIRKWLIGAIASANSIEGCKNEIILTLAGNQGIGKTTFFNSLIPKNYNHWILDGCNLNPADKDSVKIAVSHWITELGELDSTFRKADISMLKAFMSNNVDQFRPPYAHKESVFPRRTAFCASVNESNILVDDTGNRRFSVLDLEKIIPHNLDTQQLWAQALQLFNQGGEWWLTPEEETMQAAVNSTHQIIDPLEEALENHFNFNEFPFKGESLNATAILEKIGMPTNNRAFPTKMGKILAKKGLERTNSRAYKMPSLKNTMPFIS